MSDPRILGIPRSYDEMLPILRAQIEKLGLGLNQIDEICGFASGQATKWYGPSRTRKIGMQGMFTQLPELGMGVMFFETDELLAARRLPGSPLVKFKIHPPLRCQAPGMHVLARVLRHIGSIGGKKRMRKMKKRELKAHQRHAANARWKQRRAKRKARAARLAAQSAQREANQPIRVEV